MPEPLAARQHWMSVLARASEAELTALLQAAPPLPEPVLLRAPETGLAMVRGRAGGGGAPFNLGEMTVTRCTVQAGGQVGHAYRAGRDKAAALLSARLDAALQDPTLHDALHDTVIARLGATQDAARRETAARAAATKVEFFTMRSMRT
jgi:alpha-D-ribose 1-methylphosphonate 5-triphosphate synthase subunit PhnG